jgi:hypothetical protein
MLTLFIPLAGSFLSALLLILAQYKYILRCEFKNKSEYMWRATKQSIGGYADTFVALDKIRDNAKKGRFRVRTFYCPPAEIDFAHRLAELDPSHAHLYTDFAAFQEIVRLSLEIITDLIQKLSVMPASEHPKELDWLIQQHVKAAKKNLVKSADKSLNLMERLQEKDSKKKDPQDIVELRKVIEDLEEPLNEGSS